MLYWGEGNKRELNLINSDADLVRIFLQGLLSRGTAVRYYNPPTPLRRYRRDIGKKILVTETQSPAKLYKKYELDQREKTRKAPIRHVPYSGKERGVLF